MAALPEWRVIIPVSAQLHQFHIKRVAGAQYAETYISSVFFGLH